MPWISTAGSWLPASSPPAARAATGCLRKAAWAAPTSSATACRPSPLLSKTEGDTTVYSTALAGEILSRMGLHSVIVVSDGYHIYRVKKILQSRGLAVYGSPRKETARAAFRDPWNCFKQAIGYVLWRAGVAV